MPQARSARWSRPKGAIACRLCFTLAVGVVAFGCDQSSSTKEKVDYRSQIAALAGDERPTDPLTLSQQRGSAVYQHYCLICHGVDGQGNGFNASLLGTPPRNFSEEAFWKQIDDEQLFTVISRGGKAVNKSVLMPAWGHTLSEQQIRDVIAYLRTTPELAKKLEAEEEASEEQTQE